jgi:hypothetical protein
MEAGQKNEKGSNMLRHRTRASHAVSWVVAALLCVVAFATVAQTITVSPPNPPAGTPITLQISGMSPVSVPIYLYQFSIVGQTVHVEGCVPPGFEVGTSYQFPVPIGALSRGIYVVEYFTLDCGPPGAPGNPPGPLSFRMSQSFSVGNASFADTSIPALQPEMLIVLGVLVVLGAATMIRRRG